MNKLKYNDIKDYIMFSATMGSNAYGTNTESSDVDIRGIFCYPLDIRLSLKDREDYASEDEPVDLL